MTDSMDDVFPNDDGEGSTAASDNAACREDGNEAAGTEDGNEVAGTEDGNEAAENHKVATYEEGDLLWAKVGHHPYWPCMVYHCPKSEGENKYVRIRQLKTKLQYLYHVQFFGPTRERGWVPVNSTFPYEGKSDFDAYVEKCVQAAGPKSASKVRATFAVTSRHAAWKASYEEAEEALPLTPEERVRVLGRRYPGEESDDSDSEDSVASSSSEEDLPKSKLSKHKRPVVDDPDSSTLSDISECSEEGEKGTRKRKHRRKKANENGAEKEPRRKRIRPSAGASNIPVKRPFEFTRLKYNPKTKGKMAACFKCADTTPNKENPFWQCSGTCGSMFHRDCMTLCISSNSSSSSTGENENSNNGEQGEEAMYKCDECALGVSRCFICKEEGVPMDSCVLTKELLCGLKKRNASTKNGTQEKAETCNLLMRCVGKRCSQRYHAKCLLQTSFENFYRLENDRILCPQHTCHSCVLERPGNVKLTVHYVRCVLCPVAYHCGDWCIPAGSLELSSSHIICPKHLTDPTSPQHVSIMTRYRQRFTFPPEVLRILQLQSQASPSKLRLKSPGKSPEDCVSSSKVQSNGHNVNGAGKRKKSESSSSDYSTSSEESDSEDEMSPSKATAVSPYQAMNVKWCFICCKGGELLCCEQCPASFHLNCLHLQEVPQGSFNCDHCRHGVYPHYGSLFWCKVPTHEWWPGEVVHERHLPEAIQHQPHYPGQFAVRLFGVDEFYWISRAQCFPFEEGDEIEKKNRKSKKRKGKRESEEESTAANESVYEKALSTAGEAFALWKQRSEAVLIVGNRPDHYKHIKTNYPIGSVRVYKPMTLSEIPSCDCEARSSDPCGLSSSCINRELKFECHPAVCRNAELCRNQCFTLRQYPKQECFATDGRGWGLRALEDIHKGQFVNEYVGDLIDDAEAERRLQWAHENNVSNYYMMILDSQRIIDAGPRGNYSRFMNHSCAPNLYAEKWTVNGDTRVGLFALRDIKAGEELTFNYNFMTKGQERLKCCCGASNCSGFLGVPPSNGNHTNGVTDSDTNQTSSTSAARNGGQPGAKRGRHPGSKAARQNGTDTNHSRPAQRPEQDCYRCGEGGPLLMCTIPECGKGYHLLCLQLERTPESRWICPWHHCEMCGRPSEVMCSECPSSYCLLHWEDNMGVTPNDRFLCGAHEDFVKVLNIQVRRMKTREELDAILARHRALCNGT